MSASGHIDPRIATSLSSVARAAPSHPHPGMRFASRPQVSARAMKISATLLVIFAAGTNANASPDPVDYTPIALRSEQEDAGAATGGAGGSGLSGLRNRLALGELKMPSTPDDGSYAASIIVSVVKPLRA